MVAQIEGLELLWLNGLDVDLAEISRQTIDSYLLAPLEPIVDSGGMT